MSLNIAEVKNGRIYSVVFAGPVRMNKGGRAGVAPNPLQDLDVTRRMVVSVQACSRESYKRRMVKQDATWQPSDKPSGFAPTAHPCVDVNGQGEACLRGWSVGVTRNQIFVGGQPATPEQLRIIEAYRPAGKSEYTFMRLPLAKIEHEGWTDGTED
jgi:hypothetical protein